MEEIWKDVLGYEGLYKVSNLGRVLGKEKRWISGNGKVDYLPDRILKQYNSRGYKIVSLTKNSLTKTISVHRLVALSFLGDGGIKWSVNHIDGDKTNNHLSNLEWATMSKNLLHAYKNKLKKPLTGLCHQFSRIVLNTETGIYYNGAEAADSIGVKKNTLYARLSGRNKNNTSLIYV
jgi:hypothetical protein